MRPALIRIQRKVTQQALAARLRISVDDLRALEADPIGLWDLLDLQRYLSALDCRLELVSVDPFGARIALDVNGGGQ